MNNNPPSTTEGVVAEPKVEIESKTEQVQKLTDIKNEPKEIREDSLIPSEDYRTSPLFYEVANYFGVPEGDWDNAKNELSLIVDYVIKEIKSNEDDKIILKLREMEDNLYQRPNEGEKRYKVMYRYIRLASRKQAIEKSMKAFEKEQPND